MHPILFRIPLPKHALMLWWALAAVAGIAVIYALFALRKQDKNTAAGALVVAIGAGIAGYVFRETKYEAANLPIYSYGVMLGVSLVVGWYLTLTLAGRDGLPKETMANCYVITAICAIAGSRILYVATNPDEFKQASDFFALRRGGLVAYGGFLGGYLGSWAYLRANKIRLMPWADVAVPSLASGLLITRIGCYLFGCDFGKRLPETAPPFLKKLGTFPHWASGTLEGGDGSPAYVRHLELFRGSPLGAEITKANASLPVHPTQIYESLCGLALLAFLLWQRKHQKFRGQIFFSFAFGYGVLRFLLEIIRDDTERGSVGPVMGEHILIPGCLLLMSLGFIFGIALGIKNQTMRTVARVLAIAPPVVVWFMLKPPSFGASVSTQLSTSQLIALLSAVACAVFYGIFWEAARKAPKLAMSPATLGEWVEEKEEEERRAAAKKKKAAEKAEAEKKVAKKPALDEDDEEKDEKSSESEESEESEESDDAEDKAETKADKKDDSGASEEPPSDEEEEDEGDEDDDEDDEDDSAAKAKDDPAKPEKKPKAEKADDT